MQFTILEKKFAPKEKYYMPVSCRKILSLALHEIIY